MAMLSDLFDQDGKPLPNSDPLALARAMAGLAPQTAGTAFEPVTRQQQLQNYQQLEGQQQAWQTAEGSPWKPAEQGPVMRALVNALTGETGQRAMMLANFIGPGPRMTPGGAVGGPLAFKNKAPSQWLPAPGQPRGSDVVVIPRYADVPHARLTYDDGVVYYDVPKIKNPEAWPSGPPDLKIYDPGPRMFRYIDEFTWPFEPDIFVRSSIRKNDFDFLNSGKHKGSMNHATGRRENGLSVAHGVEPADGYKFSYFVKGKRIGQGSDSEPLLDVSSAKPVGRVYKASEMADLLAEELLKWQKKFGVSAEDWRALRNARYGKPLP